MKMLNKMVSCWLLEVVITSWGSCIVTLWLHKNNKSPSKHTTCERGVSKWSSSNMHHRARQLLWWEVCNLSNSRTAHSLCGLDNLQRQTMLLSTGRRDILRHNSNSKITIWVQLRNTILMYFREGLLVPSHFGPDMLWRVSMKIIWLQDRFPPSLLSSTSSAHSPGQGLFDLWIGLLSSNYTNRFLGQVFWKNSLTTWAYQQL